MLIIEDHDFGFVHIPKCAGSTIRQQLRDRDDFGGRFYRNIELPGHGWINGNHIPLALLETVLPEEYAKLRRVTSYTICRDPLDRFASSMSQRLRGRLKRDPAQMSRAEIEAEVDTVIARLSASDETPLDEFIVFARQTDYVMNRGERIVQNVIPIERMDLMFEALEHQHGLAIRRDSVWNPTVTYRAPALAGLLGRAKKITRTWLPTRSYAALRDIAVGLLTTRGVTGLDAAIRDSNRITAFVKDYYAEDTALHRAAQAKTGSVGSGSGVTAATP